MIHKETRHDVLFHQFNYQSYSLKKNHYARHIKYGLREALLLIVYYLNTIQAAYRQAQHNQRHYLKYAAYEKFHQLNV